MINSILTFHNTKYINFENLFNSNIKDNLIKEHFGILEINLPKDNISKFNWNIIFSIDNSGSMNIICSDNKTKLDYIKYIQKQT